MLDASVTLSWAFEGESTPYTVAVLKSLESVHAIVPALWPFEVASVLSTAERRGRMGAAAQAAFLERLRLLPIAIEHRPATWLVQQILPLARAHKISAYDAAYLELAIREGLPLATLDDDLRRAACAAGVELVGAGCVRPSGCRALPMPMCELYFLVCSITGEVRMPAGQAVPKGTDRM